MAGPRIPSYAEINAALTAKGSPFETIEVDMHGVKQIAFKNQVPTYGHLYARSIDKYADRVCVSSPVGNPTKAIAGEREYLTYREMGERAYALAGWMLEQGVRAGDPVAVGGLNTAKLIIALVGLHLLGAVPLVLNATLTGDAQVHCATLTRCKLILVDVKAGEAIGPVRDQLDARGAGPTYCWESLDLLPPAARAGCKELIVNPSPASVEEVKSGRARASVTPESDANIFLTSGTTSMPKGVLLTHRICMHSNTSAEYSVARHAMRLGATYEMAIAAATTPPEEQGVFLLPVPLFHVTGYIGLNRNFVNGGKIVLMRRWDPEAAIDLMIKEKVTSSTGVPSIFQSILQSPGLKDKIKLQGVSIGGSLPPERLPGDMEKAFPDLYMITAFGMTETIGAHVTLAGPDLRRKPHAAGITMPTGQLKIVDLETREECPPNVPGVILMKGSNVCKGYINNPEATAAALTKDGWLDSGDIGFLDDEGFLVVCDRQKDIIIRAGENISSAEVEHVIYSDDRIAEAAAVAVPHDLWGELVGVAVTLAPGATATPESILELARPRIRGPAQPAIIAIFDEPLARNANGKILKTEIKKDVVARWEAQGRDGGAVRAKL
ncbi:uncharacterized protein CcaverHIS019_0702680 [Cutaneotrichosporon cavernicola]|uniref:Uncharacterized protein n=1 Tax=Cutaneotrichosporon cavernicola TaxID=279322 RepID=A0AA48LA26_9TREE|nr:uncharacterized protein CcaverHIS019_0702680 [Cutaneotrichosporon cavernicola]BEI94687.1 hypothetical protein CcaverHIS019_0702680 [Cutaneotrichosporon cavernicola]BEJ02462.1 hypothetical protein CcaverHIS631_0702570 [Cutaneotrichosporon cavernicola]